MISANTHLKMEMRKSMLDHPAVFPGPIGWRCRHDESVTHSEHGTSIMPPRSPLSVRRRKECAARLRFQTITNASPRRIGLSAFKLYRETLGFAPSGCGAKARAGQTRQEGVRGLQIVAPRSIIACA